MKKFVVVFLLVIGTLTFAKSQDYETGIGLRAGFSQGITLKHFIGSNTALEGILATRWQGYEITGLYEVHNQAFDVEHLNWYYGAGAHIGFWNGDNTFSYWGKQGSNYTIIGIDGILGIEYNFTEAPINVGLDWKPALNLVGYTGFWADGGALSIRYVF